MKYKVEGEVPVKLTKFQWGNLQKLRDFLTKNKKQIEQHFDMITYIRVGGNNLHLLSDGISELGKTCDSVGCLIGWGPASGIRSYPKDEGDWSAYAKRVFGSSEMGGSALGPWLLTSNWAGMDNSLEGALWRLNWTLKHRATQEEWTVE